MKNRFEIFQALENIFLKIQNKITKVNPGSVIYSLFYSVASEIESVYEELEDLKTNSYISTATGDYLDNLIYGFSKLERIAGRRASGYVMLEVIDTVIDTTDKINSLRVFFPFYDIEKDVLNIYSGVSSLTIPTKTGSFNYYIIPPISFLSYFKDFQYFETNSLTNRQYIVDYFLSIIRQRFLKNVNKNVKYIVLPVISEEPGKDKNLDLFEINTIISFGDSKFKVTNKYDYSIADNDLVIDIDGAGKFEGGVYTLKESAIIGGGTDEETDEEYRNRFYLYLNSLGKGTIDSIEQKIKDILGNVQYKIVKTNYPGIINLYIDSKKIVSAPFTSIVSSRLEEVIPAGTHVNILLPKTTYINTLVDITLQNNLDESLLNSLKTIIANNINDIFEIGKPLLKSTVEELFLNIKNQDFNIKDYQNIYIGHATTSEMFSLYKRNYFELLKKVYYDKNYPVLPKNGFFDYLIGVNNLSFSATEQQIFEAFSYSNFLSILTSGNISLYTLLLGNNTINRFMSFIDTSFSVANNSLNITHAPRFSLEFYVEKIKTGETGIVPGIGVTRQLESIFTEAVKDFCKNIDNSLCLRQLAVSLNSSSTPSNNSSTAPYIQQLKYHLNSELSANRTFSISLSDLKNFSRPLYYYYLIKFLTIPPRSNNDIEICDGFSLTDVCAQQTIITPFDLKLYFFFLNDIKYYKLIDMDTIDLNENEIVRLYSSSIIDSITNKYFIGINAKI